MESPLNTDDREELKPAPASTGQRLAAALARTFIRSLGGTMRIRQIGTGNLEATRRASPGGHITFAFWHGHQFPLVHTSRRRGVAILTSQTGSSPGAAASRPGIVNPMVV